MFHHVVQCLTISYSCDGSTKLYPPEGLLSPTLSYNILQFLCCDDCAGTTTNILHTWLCWHHLAVGVAGTNAFFNTISYNVFTHIWLCCVAFAGTNDTLWWPLRHHPFHKMLASAHCGWVLCEPHKCEAKNYCNTKYKIQNNTKIRTNTQI